MYRIYRVLSVLFVLGICLASVSYSAENSDSQSKAKRLIVTIFGQENVDRFEQMFETNKFDFDYCDEDNRSVLHYAALLGNINRVQELVKQGADVNIKKNDGVTILQSTAQSGNMELVQWLVERGAEVKIKDNDGETALHFAALSGNVELVKWLVEHGADVNAKDNDGMTVLDQSFDKEMVKYLKEHGAKELEQ